MSKTMKNLENDNQTNKAENGVYIFDSGNLTRAVDFDTPNEIKGSFVFRYVSICKSFISLNGAKCSNFFLS